jgi:hypothetical protein
MIHEATSVSQFPHCGHKKKIISIDYAEFSSLLSEYPLLFLLVIWYFDDYENVSVWIAQFFWYKIVTLFYLSEKKKCP